MRTESPAAARHGAARDRGGRSAAASGDPRLPLPAADPSATPPRAAATPGRSPAGGVPQQPIPGGTPDRPARGAAAAAGRGEGATGRRAGGPPPAVPPTRPPLPPATFALLAAARSGLAEAATLERAADRYATAHLAALRVAAAVLAARARPADATRRHRLRSAWSLLPEVAPELAEWAAFFAAGAGKRAAAEAGLPRAATPREADDLLRDTRTFLRLVEGLLGLPHQSSLPYSESRAS